MSLVVEDGTGLPNAEGYASVAQVTAYHAAYGNDAWLDVDPDTYEVLIRKASRDVDALYGSSFPVHRLTNTQSLMFPRTSFTTNDGVSITGIPSALINAVAELALIEASIDPTGVSDDSGNEKVTIVKIGDLMAHKERFSQTSASSALLRKVGMLLSPLLVSSGSGIFVTVSRG